jgi:predicted alpha/beta-fold hydrolase
MTPFVPLFRNPHLQTIAGHYWPRPECNAPVERRLIQTEPNVQVLVHSQYPEPKVGQAPCPLRISPANGREATAPHVVLVHGLEGSSSAGYMCSVAAAAVAAGFAAHRFNLRTCGGTEHLCPTLYHAGLTSDLQAFLRQLGAPAFLVGFSLGGNIVLKLAGELGDAAPALIRGVCAVSTPIDLAASAARIADPDNRLYEARFLRRMRARLLATGRYTEKDFAGLRSVTALDDRITAPSFGFQGAKHYYETQSALGYLSQIRVPALLIQAKDDTFVPYRIYESSAVRSNPAIRILATDHGGHLGFLAKSPHRLWTDRIITKWITAGPEPRP